MISQKMLHAIEHDEGYYTVILPVQQINGDGRRGLLRVRFGENLPGGL